MNGKSPFGRSPFPCVMFYEMSRNFALSFLGSKCIERNTDFYANMALTDVRRSVSRTRLPMCLNPQARCACAPADEASGSGR